jgi:hypothetical protein
MPHTASAVGPILDREEWRLIQALRGLPPSPLRARLIALIDELVDFAREPRCPEAQADGVPCESAQRSCDQCLQLTALVEMLRNGLRRH